MTVNNELERMWKEVVVVHFEVLSGGTEENYVNLSQDSQ
jgi:hypothetical protein